MEPFIPPSPPAPRPESNEPPILPPSPGTVPFTHALNDESVVVFLPSRQIRPPYVLVLHLYPLISYNPYNVHGCADMVWDIIHPPEYARVPADRSLIGKRWRKLDMSIQATMPSVEKVWILSDHPSLSFWMTRWGPIIVRSDMITIGDILQGIYRYLRKPLTREDLADVSRAGPRNQETLRWALEQRAKDSREIEAVVIAHGYKRVDLMGAHRRFRGMRIVILPDNTWRLYVGLCPGPVPVLP